MVATYLYGAYRMDKDMGEEAKAFQCQCLCYTQVATGYKWSRTFPAVLRAIRTTAGMHSRNWQEPRKSSSNVFIGIFGSTTFSEVSVWPYQFLYQGDSFPQIEGSYRFLVEGMNNKCWSKEPLSPRCRVSHPCVMADRNRLTLCGSSTPYIGPETLLGILKSLVRIQAMCQ